MFKTKREARLNLNVNYLCYALRALFWTLIIINWTLIISLIFSLMFILVRPINCSLSASSYWEKFYLSLNVSSIFLCFNCFFVLLHRTNQTILRNQQVQTHYYIQWQSVRYNSVLSIATCSRAAASFSRARTSLNA